MAEIIAAPFEVYISDPGIGAPAFPAINEAPGAGWSLFGKHGNESYSEDGVSVTHEQTTNEIFVLGTTAPIEVRRSQERLTIEFTLLDLSLEGYASALNRQAVTDTPPQTGVAGYRTMQLQSGLTVALVQLLIRGPSPYEEVGGGWTGNMQYEIPYAYSSAEPNPVFNKSDAAGLTLQFSALRDRESGAFATLRAMDAAPGA